MEDQDLRNELDAVVDELNAKGCRPDDCYQYELGNHMDGIAIDITKDGKAPKKVLSQFCEAAMRAGYVTVGTYYDDSYGENTRIYLHKADEHFNTDAAKAEGFMAGVFFATAMASEMGTPDEEVLFDGTEGASTALFEAMDDREAIVAPYGIGQKPRDVDRFDARHSVIDDEHYVWALEDTNEAVRLKDKKATVTTEKDSGKRSDLTVEDLRANER